MKLKACNLFVFFLFPFYTLYAQDNRQNTVTENFKNYQSQVYLEKVYVHTDKDFYTSGEIIWFCMYAAEATSNRLSDVSKVAYAEILDAANHPVAQMKIELKNGVGSGSFQVPPSFISGVYTLRAYTNWMKNFDADFFFSKPITIINALKKPAAPTAKENSRPHIEYFPEGGQLVNDIQSKVAFLITDANGKGINTTGALISSNNDTVVRFAASHAGMGNFHFTPAKGLSYRLVAAANTATAEIKGIQENGYVLSLADEDDNHWYFTVQSSNKETSDNVYLFGFTRQVIKASKKNNLINGKAEFVFDKKDFGDGISVFTLFNSSAQPVCERLVFKMPANTFDITITSGNNYKQRSKVNMDVKVNAGQNIVTDAHLSASVFLIDPLQQKDQQHILSYMMLASELKGYIEDPDYYFAEGTQQKADMENLLLTHGWRKYNWDEILTNKKPVFSFLPEYEGHLLQLNIKDKISGLAPDNISGTISIPQKRYQFAASAPSINGKLFFNLKDFFGLNETVIKIHPGSADSFFIEPVSPFSDKFISYYSYFNPEKKDTAYLNTRIASAQVQNAFHSKDMSVYGASFISNTLPFFGKADKTYLLDNYTRFKTIEEILREYVTEVRLRKEDKGFYMRVQDQTGYFFVNDPLVLYDGIPVYDLDNFMQTDPLGMQKLEVLARKNFYGGQIIEGVVAFSSYEGNNAGYDLNKDAFIFDYEGLQFQREFYSPSYETPDAAQSRMPDQRITLFWNADIKTNTEGKAAFDFYTSDVPGNYLTVIEGMSNNGTAGTGLFSFEVK